MTMTKATIVEIVSSETGFAKNRATEVTETMLEIIKNTLSGGEDVLISGFGKFCVKAKNERLGRNPATGESMLLNSRKVVTFRCSNKLRDRLNLHR